jgi:pimeloyl-ACP methyl ester carboxylesterase
MLYPHYRRLNLAAMRAYFARMTVQDCTTVLPHIHAPVLVLAGAADPTVPPAQAHWIAQHLPQATLALVEGAGHALFAERPEEYRRVIIDWLERTEPMPGQTKA